MTQYNSNSGIIDQKSYASLYSKTFDKISKRVDESPREGGQFFASRTTNEDTFKEGEVSSVLDLPQKNEDTDRIPMLNPVEGFNKTWTNVQYRSGIIVTDRAVLAQKTNMISKMIIGLPTSAMRKEEYAYASIFNNGFDSETTADGLYVFSDSHLHEDAEAGTWDNLMTASGITTDSVATARLHFSNWVNEKGFTDPKAMSKIVTPSALWEDAQNVLKSNLYPQNSLNAKNPFQNMAEAFEYHWLTSTTAWFVCGDMSEMDKGFLTVWQTKPNYKPISDTMNPELILGRRLLMRFSVGALHARNILGNAGA